MRILLLIALLALAGCANEPAGDKRSELRVYPVTEDQANKIIRDSLLEAFPGTRPARVDKPGQKGFQSRKWFAADNHRIRGYYRVAKGRRPDGSIVPGFRFRVRHSGSMPITGPRWARRFHRVLHRRAAEVAAPLPSVP
ncbi:MAG TPA: hypothetical protein VM325_02885 [Alphaproteobacteria bacterium]|nr:hypothetical protein [Alphaproteobacteria bacterium]